MAERSKALRSGRSLFEGAGSNPASIKIIFFSFAPFIDLHALHSLIGHVHACTDCKVDCIALPSLHHCITCTMCNVSHTVHVLSG